MTTLEKIRAEIEQIQPYDLPWDKRTPEHIRDMAIAIIDKYAEQEIDIAYIGEFCHKHGLVLMSKEMADKYAEQEPCDKCEVGNSCLYCKYEFEPKESEDKEC